MITKDLAYSEHQLRGYLCDMANVNMISENEFTYKNAAITIKRKGRGGALNFERTNMFLSGESNDIEEFYSYFLVHYMTMGG